jgi:hypothetical protein
VHELATALLIQRGGDDTDPYEWIDAISDAQMRVDMSVLRHLVQQFLTKK